MTGTRTQGTSPSSLRRSAIRLAALLLLAASGLPCEARATNDGNWSALPFPPPSPRVRHTAIYDPVRNRMVVFGGLAGSTPQNDVWELTLSGTPAWHQIVVSGVSPGARSGHSAIYDPVRDRMIIYGGQGSSLFGDVWALSFTGTPSWTQLAPTGTPPTARVSPSAIYDPVRDRVVVWAGQGTGGYKNDVWSLTLSGTPAWSQLLPSGGPPPGRSRSTAIYDSARDRMVVFGGKDATTFYNDVWTLSMGTPTWATLTPSGTGPTARYGQAGIYDPVRDRMVLFGGNDGGDPLDPTVWTIGFAGTPAWGTLSPSGSGPPGTYDLSGVYDSTGDRMLLFAGFTELTTNQLAVLGFAGSPSWVTLSPTGVPPSPRTDHGAVYDPVRGRMLVIDGYGGSDFQDVWSLDLNLQTWTKLQPTGTAPSARDGHVLVYDSTRDRVLLFGGTTAGNFLNDTWALTLSGTPAWSQLTPTGTPPAGRTSSAGVYDPGQDRLVVYGGFDGTVYGDVWSLSLAGTPSWSQLAPSGTPPLPRFLHEAVRISTTNRMLVFGGTDSSLFNDVWTLTLTNPPTWSHLAPSGTPPVPRYESAAMYDSTRLRVVLFGGFDGTNLLSDTWSLSLSGSPAWAMLAPTGLNPTPRYGHSAIYDVPRDRMVVFGGQGSNGQLNDTWALAWNGVTGVAEAPGDLWPGIRLRQAYPNPFHSLATIPVDLASPREVKLAVFDARGRLVRELSTAVLPAGVSRFSWDGADAAGNAVAAGTYFYRLESGAVRLTRKVVLLK